MTETISDRVQRAIHNKGVDMKTASKMAGLGETYVRDVIKRGLNPTASAIVKLAEALAVSPEWLLTGRERDISDGGSDLHNELIMAFDTLREEDQDVVLAMMRSLAAANGRWR